MDAKILGIAADGLAEERVKQMSLKQKVLEQKRIREIMMVESTKKKQDIEQKNRHEEKKHV